MLEELAEAMQAMRRKRRAGRLFVIYNFIMYIYGAKIMQVSKWGNSLAVRLPASVVEALKLKEGDDIEIEVADARRFDVRKSPVTRRFWRD